VSDKSNGTSHSSEFRADDVTFRPPCENTRNDTSEIGDELTKEFGQEAASNEARAIKLINGRAVAPISGASPFVPHARTHAGGEGEPPERVTVAINRND